MKAIARLLVVAGCLLAAPEAGAISITVDWGSPGFAFQNSSRAFRTLDGTAFSGQTLSLDFVFAGTDALQVTFDPTNPTNEFFVVRLILAHNEGLAGLPPDPIGFLSDEGGSNIASPELVSASETLFDTRYELRFSEAAVEGLIFHGIHFDVALPLAAGFQVTLGPILPIELTEIYSGIMVVPEPSSTILFATGLATLAALACRACRHREGA